MNSTYYSKEAYNSSHTKVIPLQDNSKFSETTQRLRKRPLPLFFDSQCGEFISVDDIEIIELLNSEDKETLDDIASPGHEIQQWETLHNPKAVVEIITGVMQFFAISFWVCFLLIISIALFKHPQWLVDPKAIIIILIPTIPTVIVKAGNYLIASGKVGNKNNIVLNRRKGTVLCPSKKNPNQEIPFEEFDPYLNHSANSSGRICYHLTLHHRYSEEWISYPIEQDREWKVYQEWEFWQQYMDVSKPLPDTPKMEPYRSRDPVTAAYDKKHNRPPGYWKNMDPEKANQMQDASLEAGSKYPWGSSREDALAKGWRPSGVGEGDWRSNPECHEQSGHGPHSMGL